MKYLTALFRDDGSLAGVLGHELPLPAGWEPPPYTNAGETQLRRFLPLHLGAAEMPGGGRCVSEDLFDALESDPASTAAAPRFAVKVGARLPQIFDAPCRMEDLPAWFRTNGTQRMPKPLRAWLTLTMPQVAAAYGVDAGVTIEDMIAVEEKRVGVPPEKSRLEHLRRRAARRDAEKREQAFARNQDRVAARANEEST